MSGEKILVRFGQNVQRIRKEHNISQEKLAEYAGLHRTYIGVDSNRKVYHNNN